MLTKTDLEQMKKVVREEIVAETENSKTELLSEIKLTRMKLSTDNDKVKDRLKNIEIDIREIKKDLKIAVNFLDKEGLKIQKRVENIENHLQISPVS